MVPLNGVLVTENKVGEYSCPVGARKGVGHGGDRGLTRMPERVYGKGRWAGRRSGLGTVMEERQSLEDGQDLGVRGDKGVGVDVVEERKAWSVGER